MEEVLFSTEIRLFSPPEAQRLLEDLFVENAWFLLEQPHNCVAGKIADLPPNWHEQLWSCTIFSPQTEMLIEPEGTQLCCRIVREGAGQKAWARRHNYLLRKHSVNEPLLMQKKLPLLQHTEYFVPDAQSGMPCRVAERLSGIFSTTDSREEI